MDPGTDGSVEAADLAALNAHDALDLQNDGLHFTPPLLVLVGANALR